MFGKPQYAEINALLNKKYAEKKHLIAVHRGSYTGNSTQNTIPAYIAAIRMGADMVEGDINSTTDDILYVFHDGHEPDVFGVEKHVKTMSYEELEALRPYNAVFGRVGRRINRLVCKTIPVISICAFISFPPRFLQPAQKPAMRFFLYPPAG